MSRGPARRSPSSDARGPTRRVLATHRRARHDYHLDEIFEAGLVLKGSEVKSLRGATPSLAEGYARLDGSRLWLHGMHIPPLPQAALQNHEPTRPRECLLHKRELKKLAARLAVEGTTIVPLELYFKGPRVKVSLALARGRRKGDRRAREREKEDRRRIREVTGG